MPVKMSRDPLRTLTGSTEECLIEISTAFKHYSFQCKRQTYIQRIDAMLPTGRIVTRWKMVL